MSVQGNAGGNGQSPAALKSTVQPENRVRSKETSPPPNEASSKLTLLPENEARLK